MNENDDYLEHFGILGMHWGIRRYQNKDGTLTPEGKQRYRTDKKFREDYDYKHPKEKPGYDIVRVKGSKKVQYLPRELPKDPKERKKVLSQLEKEKNEILQEAHENQRKRNTKIGIAAGAAALAAIGGYALYKSGKLDPLIAKGKQRAKEIEFERFERHRKEAAENWKKNKAKFDAEMKEEFRKNYDPELEEKIEKAFKQNAVKFSKTAQEKIRNTQKALPPVDKKVRNRAGLFMDMASRSSDPTIRKFAKAANEVLQEKQRPIADAFKNGKINRDEYMRRMGELQNQWLVYVENLMNGK